MKLDKLKDKRIFNFVVTNPGIVDKEQDVVPADEIMEAMTGWMIRGAPMSIGHSNNIIARGLNFYKDYDGKIIATGLVHDDSQVADEVWNGIKQGKYKSVSIGGAAFEKTPNEFGGQNLNGLEILEVAVCEEGMHQDANILEKNDFAKGTPFFAKAVIQSTQVLKPGPDSTHTDKWDRCVEHVKQKNPSANAYAVCTAAMGKEGTFKSENDLAFVKEIAGLFGDSGKSVSANSNNSLEFQIPTVSGYTTNFTSKNYEVKKNMGIDVLKNPQLIAELKALIAKYEQMANGNGAPAPMAGPPEPVAQSAETLKQEGGDLGTKGINPSDEGGKVKLPVSPDDERNDIGEAGKQIGDKGESVMEKLYKEMTEIKSGLADVKKFVPKSVSTPSPQIQKGYGGTKKDPAMLALDIAQGRTKIDNSDFFKSREKERLRRELSSMEAYDAFVAKTGGGF